MDPFKLYITLQTAILWWEEGDSAAADDYVREAMDDLWALLDETQRAATRQAAEEFEKELEAEK